jgi:hypothetical protein
MDGWTDKHDKASSRFSQFSGCTKNYCHRHNAPLSINYQPSTENQRMEGISTVTLLGSNIIRPEMCKSNPHLAIKYFASNFFLIFLAL